MSRSPSATRRATLAGLGAPVASGSAGTVAAAAESDWTVEETDSTLHDVVSANAGRFAVGGGSGGLVLRR